jgi:hypothetical protein
MAVRYTNHRRFQHSFGSGSWYTTEKDPARAIPFKTFRCDVEAVVVLREVRRNYTTLQPFELRCKPPTLPQASVQVAGILRIPQEPFFKTFRCDVEAVVLLS